MSSCRVLGSAAECAFQHSSRGGACSSSWRSRRPLTAALPPAWPGRRKLDYIQLRARSSSTTPPSPPPSLSDHLRLTMRRLANPVVVCTAGTTTSTPTPVPIGMTMSSLTSLSLAGPGPPVVTFNMAVPSRTEAALRATRQFAVHVLAGDASGARVAEAFSRGNAADGHERIARGLRETGCVVVEEEEGRGGEGAAPVLRGPGVLAVLRCRVLGGPEGGLVRVRDHVVVLGEVVEIVEGEEGEAGGLGLVYADRQYRQLGEVLGRHDET